MGLEANTLLIVNGDEFEVKALLESNELILRGGYKARLRFENLANVRANDGRLIFENEGKDFRLELGQVYAEKWAIKISSPPKPLFEKLGIKPNDNIYVFGKISEENIILAISGSIISSANEAILAFTQFNDLSDIEKMLNEYSTEGFQCPIWTIHGKGKTSAPNGDIVRKIMRANGFIDTKICAISDDWSATKYSLKKN
ncbi:MAG: hypothetical protein FD163_517 [Hyphomonadaceae bacterium]|nr:MAG: hypothetical protein FD128_1712 [Hyphomonadaceae bacterium]KAF0185849.1 MAG: hypothetical protein FD163_517 [Hyphomonadaceae bacterium]